MYLNYTASLDESNINLLPEERQQHARLPLKKSASEEPGYQSICIFHTGTTQPRVLFECLEPLYRPGKGQDRDGPAASSKICHKQT